MPLSAHRDFIYLDANALKPIGNGSVVPRSAGAVTCLLASGDGVSFSVAGLQVLRLRFKMVEPVDLSRLVATAYAGDELVARWTWNVKPGELKSGSTISTAMRPG